MNNQLKKAIELVKKTGDRIIIFDTARSDYPYVLMSLNEYEKLVIGKSEVRGLTEDELLDKINRDIAIWKSEQELDKLARTGPYEAEFSQPSPGEPVPIREILDKSGPMITKKRWTIPDEIKDAAEEVIEEDRQYFEDVDY